MKLQLRTWSVAHVGRRARTLAIATLVGTLALGVLGPSAVLAAGNAACTNNGAATNDHAGAGRNGATVGAEAKIDNFAPLLCLGLTDGLSGSFTYVSVEAGGNSIVQVGLIKCKVPGHPACDGTYRWAWAWGRQNGVGNCHDTVIAIARNAGVAAAGLHRFTVYRNANQVVFQVDGGASWSDSIPIGDVNCWNGTAMRADGETLDAGDQLGGLVGAHQHITSAIYQGNVGGAWASPNFTSCQSTSGLYHCARIGPQAVDVWTDRS